MQAATLRRPSVPASFDPSATVDWAPTLAPDSFAAFRDRLASDEQGAARDVFHRYARGLIALARRQFEKRLAHRVDPEDVVQSAFKSFFVRQRDGRVRVETWNNLWGLLTLITLRKCADRVEYLRAGRRDVGREVAAPGDEVQPWEVAPGREPSAHEAAVLAETVERLFRCVDEDARPVLELSLQGYSAAEIALRLGRALRTVHRLRERVQKQLLRLRADG
ncbi:MAG TPA: sigma-70 family RNA polymerase sigma factor [Gemmataceae bacterium]|nr:sigma-70 family RNA polymerase sigma factor [Gemmataceae bacterium]